MTSKLHELKTILARQNIRVDSSDRQWSLSP